MAGHATAAQTCYFGECVTSAPAPKAARSQPGAGDKDALQVEARCGDWSLLSNSKMVALVYIYPDQARFAIVKGKGPNGTTSLSFYDPNWNLDQGQDLAVSLDIDGETFTGHVKADSNRMDIVDGIKPSLLQAIYQGRVSEIKVGNSRWTIEMGGALGDQGRKNQRPYLQAVRR